MREPSEWTSGERLEEVRALVNPTPTAMAECATAMAYLVTDVGWPKEALDDLEVLWWKVRDRHGRVRQ